MQFQSTGQAGFNLSGKWQDVITTPNSLSFREGNPRVESRHPRPLLSSRLTHQQNSIFHNIPYREKRRDFCAICMVWLTLIVAQFHVRHLSNWFHKLATFIFFFISLPSFSPSFHSEYLYTSIVTGCQIGFNSI